MDECHFRTVRDVELGGERGRCEHGHDGHPVHVIGDGFAGADGEATPAFARGGLEAFEEVEEGDRGGGVGRGSGG